jgi:hypothetical protein
LIATISAAVIAAKEPADETTAVKQQITEAAKRGIQDSRSFNAEKCASRFHNHLRYVGLGEELPEEVKPQMHRVEYWETLFERRTFRDIVRKIPEDFWVLEQAHVWTKAECEQHARRKVRAIGKEMAADEYLIYVPTKASLQKRTEKRGKNDGPDETILQLLPPIAEVYRKIEGEWIVVGVPFGGLNIKEVRKLAEDRVGGNEEQKQ